MSLSQRNAFQALIEATELSSIVNGRRDCQKWGTECMAHLGFGREEVTFWDGLLGKDVFEIEAAVERLAEKLGWEF